MTGNNIKQTFGKELENVTTVAEAARLYGVDRKTVTYAIDAGHLVAVKRGGTWLVSVSSLVAWFGEPKDTKIRS